MHTFWVKLSGSVCSGSEDEARSWQVFLKLSPLSCQLPEGKCNSKFHTIWEGLWSGFFNFGQLLEERWFTEEQDLFKI